MFKYDEFPLLRLQVYNSQGILNHKTYRLKSHQPYFQNQNYSLTNIIDYQTSQHMTLKKIYKSKNLSKDLTLSQINNQSKMKNNNNFIQIKQVYQDHDNIYLFMEQNHSNLSEILLTRKSLLECQVQYIYCQIIVILENLRKNNIFHGGICLNNLYLDCNTMKIKLSGFENSINLQKFNENCLNNLYTFAELTSYIAPEMLQCNVMNWQSYYAADIWAVGVVLYTLLIGEQPFTNYDSNGKIKIASLMKIKNFIYQFPKPNLNHNHKIYTNNSVNNSQISEFQNRNKNNNQNIADKISITAIWKQLLKKIFLPLNQRINLIQLINHPLNHITQSKFRQIQGLQIYPPRLSNHHVSHTDKPIDQLRFNQDTQKLLYKQKKQKDGYLHKNWFNYQKGSLQLFKPLSEPPNLYTILTTKTTFQFKTQIQLITGGDINNNLLSIILQQQKLPQPLPLLSTHPPYIQKYCYIKKYNCLGYIYQNNIGVIYADGSCLIGQNSKQYTYMDNNQKQQQQLLKIYTNLYTQFYQQMSYNNSNNNRNAESDLYTTVKINTYSNSNSNNNSNNNNNNMIKNRKYKIQQSDYINQTNSFLIANQTNPSKLSVNSNVKNSKRSFQNIQNLISTSKISPQNSGESNFINVNVGTGVNSKIKKYKMQDYTINNSNNNNINNNNNNGSHSLNIPNIGNNSNSQNNSTNFNNNLKQTKFAFRSNSSFNINGNGLTKTINNNNNNYSNNAHSHSLNNNNNKFHNSTNSQQFTTNNNIYTNSLNVSSFPNPNPNININTLVNSPNINNNNNQSMKLRQSLSSFNNININIQQKQFNTKKQINITKYNIYQYFVQYFGQRVINSDKQEWIIGFWRLNCGIVLLFNSGLWQVNLIQAAETTKRYRENQNNNKQRQNLQSQKINQFKIIKQCAILIDKFGLAWFLNQNSQEPSSELHVRTVYNNLHNSSNLPISFGFMENITKPISSSKKLNKHNLKPADPNKCGYNALCVKIARKAVKEIKNSYIKQFQNMMEPFRFRNKQNY